LIRINYYYSIWEEVNYMGVLDNLTDFFTEDTESIQKAPKKHITSIRGKKGGISAKRGLAAATKKTRARVASAGGRATRTKRA